MPAEKRSRFLSNIRIEASRIQDLVDRMLKLSELEAQKTLQNVESIQLGTLAAEVLESKEPMLSSKGLRVSSQINDQILVQGDPFLLHQALSNMIQNAIDFSEEGGAIGITAGLDEGMVAVAVEDEGPGIPDYCRDKVFDRFFSLQRPATGKKSTGLGLNLVREVAVLHGGEVRLENLPGKGLRAVLSLPIWV
jgi:two-component system sensor histidine kinase CreC